MRQNHRMILTDYLLGRYIESLRECEDGSVAHMALYEGVQALLDTKRS